MVISYDHISNHIDMLCNYVLNLNSDPQSKFIPTFLQFVLFLLLYLIHIRSSWRLFTLRVRDLWQTVYILHVIVLYLFSKTNLNNQASSSKWNVYNPGQHYVKSIFYFGLFIFHLSSSLNCILVQFTVCEGWVEFHIVIKIKICEKVYYCRYREIVGTDA